MSTGVRVPVLGVQGSSSLVAVLQGQGRALQLLPQSHRLPLSLPPLLPLSVQLALTRLFVLLQPRGLQQTLVSSPGQRLGLQRGLAKLRLQLLLSTARCLHGAALPFQFCPESLDGELQLVTLGEEERTDNKWYFDFFWSLKIIVRTFIFLKLYYSTTNIVHFCEHVPF